MKAYRKMISGLMSALLFLHSIPLAAANPLLTSAEDADTVIMVSLGDSYSSGEGMPPFYGQTDADGNDLDRTVKGKNQDWCAHRSTLSWPGQLKISGVSGTMAEHRSENWYFAAISGAKIEHLYNTFDKEYEYTDAEGTEQTDTTTLDAQLSIFEAIPANTVDYVTITIGGNDVGFSEILTTAVTMNGYEDCETLKNQISDIWDKFDQPYTINDVEHQAIKEEIRQAYFDIAKAAGEQAKIIVAGYPVLLDPAGGDTTLKIAVGNFYYEYPAEIDQKEAKAINDATVTLNSKLKKIVEECREAGLNIYFAPVTDQFKGHSAFSEEPYINGVISEKQSEDLKSSFVSAYSVHPNEKGAEAYARSVQQLIDKLEQEPVSFIGKDGTADSTSYYTTLTGAETADESGCILLGDETYFVGSDVTYTLPLRFNANTRLILKDGCTLTASGGISCAYDDGSACNLSVFAQEGGTGCLTVQSASGDALTAQSYTQYGGTVTVGSSSADGVGLKADSIELKGGSFKDTTNAGDTYTVTWENDDGTTLKTDTFEYGTIPAYGGIPEKEGDAQYSYTFTGWSDGTTTYAPDEALPNVAGNMTYTAVFEQVANIYTLTVNSDGNGTIRVFAENADASDDAQLTELTSGAEVAYGTKLTVFRTPDAGYTLVGAAAETIEVTGDTVISLETAARTFALNVTADNGSYTANVEDTAAVPYGMKVTLTAGDPAEGYEFIGWYQPNGKLLTSDAAYSVSMTSDNTVEARYQQTSGVVNFMSNGNVVSTITKPADEFTETDFPSAPAPYYGFEFAGWDKTVDGVKAALTAGQNITVNAVFAPVQASFTVSVYNGESETPETIECNESTVITRTAAAVDGKNFAYWKLDGEIFSYNRTASYRATTAGTLMAVYAAEAVESIGTATIRTGRYNVDTRKLTVNAYLTVPDDCIITSAGLVAAPAGSFSGELTWENAAYKKELASANGKCAPVNYTWNKSSVNPGDVWCVRAHIAYTDANSEPHEIYGELVTVSAGRDYDCSEKGTATIKAATYHAGTKKATFNAYLTVPDNAVIVKAGLVAASGEHFDPDTAILTSDNADYVKSLAAAVGKCAPVNYTWNKSNVTVGDTWYARAYLVYTLDGAEHTVYGDLAELTA